MDVNVNAIYGTTGKPDSLTYGALNYINKEISWLEFNDRILKEAGRKGQRPLDRLKFLSIWRSNLDEFIQVRVGALIHKRKINPDYVDPINRQSRDELLEDIRDEIGNQYLEAYSCYNEILAEIDALSVKIGSKKPMINVLRPFDRIANIEELEPLYQKYRNFLDIAIVRKNDPMPMIESGKPYIIINLTGKKETYAIIDLSRLPSWMNFTPANSNAVQTIVHSTTFISQFIDRLFKNHTVNTFFQFRILRNADIMLSSESCKGNEMFQKFIRKMVHHRKFMRPIRLEILPCRPGTEFDDPTVKFLLDRFNLDEKDLHIGNLPFVIDFSAVLMDINADPNNPLISTSWGHFNRQKLLKIPDGKLIPYLTSNNDGVLADQNYRELLLHFPYDSIITLINLLYEAANSPTCRSITISLYRLAENSRIAAALAYAASMGKDVTCILELRARFNESSNADYSDYFRNSGCKVVYGLPDYKVHAKFCFIEGQDWGISVIGTGNFNEKTATIYSDLLYIRGEPYRTENLLGIKFLTTDMYELCDRLVGGYEKPIDGQIVSGSAIKVELLKQLDKQKSLGSDGYICLKMNGLDDLSIIEKIVECEEAGVAIDLIVRGICCLIPTKPNLRIFSVIGRYLEHSRIFWFGKQPAGEAVYIGSCDLRERNLNRRIEVMVQPRSTRLRTMIKTLLNLQLAENARKYQLNGFGIWEETGIDDIHEMTTGYLLNNNLVDTTWSTPGIN